MYFFLFLYCLSACLPLFFLRVCPYIFYVSVHLSTYLSMYVISGNSISALCLSISIFQYHLYAHLYSSLIRQQTKGDCSSRVAQLWYDSIDAKLLLTVYNSLFSSFLSATLPLFDNYEYHWLSEFSFFHFPHLSSSSFYCMLYSLTLSIAFWIILYLDPRFFDLLVCSKSVHCIVHLLIALYM